jgi:hypothetical protein
VLAALDAYRKILNDRTTLVLSASSGMLKLLTDGIPELKSRPEPVPRTTARPPLAPNGKSPTGKAALAPKSGVPQPHPPAPAISGLSGGGR